MNTKPRPSRDDVVNAEQAIRDSERHLGRDPDAMPVKIYRAAVADALATEGFDVDGFDVTPFLDFP